MLKRFFISMLGTMAGIWLSLIIIFIGLMLMFANLFGSEINPYLFKDKILYISLAGDIPEYNEPADISILATSDIPNPDPLSDILAALRRGKDDEQVKGVFLDCRDATMGTASRQELMEAIKEFRKSGKWVYAYADNFSQGDYLVATGADKVYLNPVGSLDVHGICATNMYFTDLLKEIGIGMDIVKVGDYKSAVEPFIRMDMSEEDREQTTLYVDNLWNSITSMIAENRGLEAATVDGWADDFAFAMDPETFVIDRGLDGLRYLGEVEDELREKMGLDQDEELPLVSVAEYMMVTADKAPAVDDSHIAVLYAVGDITESGPTGIASDRMVPVINNLAKDENVKGMVLRINSGGGSAFASEQIWKALEDFKATGKPFYVSMSDVAASGGYYIACGADRIYADQTTITGSIGIFGIIPNAAELMRDKLHLGWDSVSTNANAAFPSLMYPMTDQQKEKMQVYVERGYDTFVDRVSRGRAMSPEAVKEIGGGRVWDGVSAKEIGLVDEFGSLDTVLAAITAKVGLNINDYINYPDVEYTMIDVLAGRTSVSMKLNIEGLPAEEAANLLEIYRKVSTIAPLQARSPKVIID